jgi:hypothetical protein
MALFARSRERLPALLVEGVRAPLPPWLPIDSLIPHAVIL